MPTNHDPQCHIFIFLNTSKEGDPTASLGSCASPQSSLGEEDFPNIQPEPPLVQLCCFLVETITQNEIALSEQIETDKPQRH